VTFVDILSCVAIMVVGALLATTLMLFAFPFIVKFFFKWMDKHGPKL
jgi:hypothetical protein